MRSMGKFVHRRLGSIEGKEAYRIAMQDCINYVSCGLESMTMIKAKIEGVRDEAQHRYPKKFFNKRIEEYRCHDMAVSHALDIVNSLEARFITGQSDSEPRGYKGYGIIYETNEELFQ